ncbi:MAG: hypothetical protein J7465_15385 [Chloroflexus sp.]|uniref:hypothetical protein n=1 Tax=Chloroflexus sp. Y-396-1 TaxID=867845 RepID=UPI000491CD41|nr:hypothetical protein [Chloroflexus sp. Y-396-1]MBO9313587.1 hypothetical protein [Chloroflexus sp.]
MKHSAWQVLPMAEGLGTNILLVTAPVETEARSSVMVVIPYKDALSQRRRSGKVSAIMPVTVG